MPRPRKAERYSPLRTFSTAWRTRHSSWRRRASGDEVGAVAEAAGVGERKAKRVGGRGERNGKGESETGRGRTIKRKRNENDQAVVGRTKND
jgi:hypothetical protein